MKPRIFISAVTSELGKARQLVANVMLRIGYDPVWQEILGTESGDLQQVLRVKIDDCDGLIQLVGRGYGAEPPTFEAEFADDGFTRVSYTQFEFLYARASGKKTWLIFTDDGCTFDSPLQKLDLPHDPAHPDPIGYQSERRALQDAWRQRWQEKGHARYRACSDDQLELRIYKLADEFAKMRRGFRVWQRIILCASVTAVLLLGCVLVGQRLLNSDTDDLKKNTEFGFEKTESQLAEIAEQMGALKPDNIKEQLRKTIEATYQKELQAADKLTDWQKREEAKRDANEARDKHLGQFDKFLASITSRIQSGDASPEFLELTRIIQEEGVDEALAYIISQESRLLERAENLATEKQREIRRELAPLLEGVRLYRAKGKFADARKLCDKLLKKDGDWLDVLHEHYATMIELGDRATKYETVEVAQGHFEVAVASAKRLVQADAHNPVWQRDLSVSLNRLGDVYLTLGRTDDSLACFEAGLTIRRQLAEDDPSDVQKQRDLSVSYERMGDVFLMQGLTDAALVQYKNAFADQSHAWRGRSQRRAEAARSVDFAQQTRRRIPEAWSLRRRTRAL